MTHTLLERIEAFCERAGMSATRFGQEAMADRNFVFRLRNGRRCFEETVAKVDAFIAARDKLLKEAEN